MEAKRATASTGTHPAGEITQARWTISEKLKALIMKVLKGIKEILFPMKKESLAVPEVRSISRVMFSPPGELRDLPMTISGAEKPILESEKKDKKFHLDQEKTEEISSATVKNEVKVTQQESDVSSVMKIPLPIFQMAKLIASKVPDGVTLRLKNATLAEMAQDHPDSPLGILKIEFDLAKNEEVVNRSISFILDESDAYLFDNAHYQVSEIPNDLLLDFGAALEIEAALAGLGIKFRDISK